MEVILRGVRGSIADPAAETSYYGGNTACIEVRTSGEELVIFDAGSGIRTIGDALGDSGVCHLFITHAHIDHVLGLPFFKPMHRPEWTTYLYIPEWLPAFPGSFLGGGSFPVPFTSFAGNIIRRPVTPGDSVHIGTGRQSALVEALEVSHPDRGLAYRMHADGAVFFYSGDHEITADSGSRAFTRDILRGADLAVVDAMYSRSTYHPGWGHSAWEDWVELAGEASVKTLVLTHHEPGREDRSLDALQKQLEAVVLPGNSRRLVAREGMRFTPPAEALFAVHSSEWEREFWDELSRYKEEHAILDRILAKAREITNADAGTVFLIEKDELVFAYSHNDSLYTNGNAHKQAYTSLRLPITADSIAGYAAATGETLNLADVRDLPANVPYRFNAEVDAVSGYITCSMLTVPLHDRLGKLTGVLQLINSLDPRTGRAGPFSSFMERHIGLLAREAANILERSALLRTNVYNILRMAAVHDPFETGPHVERVGAVAAELFQAWADTRKMHPDAVRYEKSRIRLASMLHDIGKVGISDIILKKPGKLTDEEFTVMRGHTALGASILAEGDEDITDLARDIALNHHQKWNGTGYAGSGHEGKLAGEDIPIAARITSIADVFDALVSPRCYKKPWSFDEAMDLLRKEAGESFDPLLVECILEMREMLHLIYARFPDVPFGGQKSGA